VHLPTVGHSIACMRATSFPFLKCGRGWVCWASHRRAAMCLVAVTRAIHIRHCRALHWSFTCLPAAREDRRSYESREYRGPSDYDNVETFGLGASG
jgi:hypothetical protein